MRAAQLQTKNMQMNSKQLITLCFIAAIYLAACQKQYAPKDLDSFNLESSYTQIVFNPILGRNTLYENIFLDGNKSSRPLTFKLANVRTYDGLPAPELSEPFPVYVWNQQYTGTETSLEEIEGKRSLEKHAFLEIREHSGGIVFWGSNETLARSIKPLPDSGYTFDVHVGNSGGSKVIKGLRVQPYILREYEPNNAGLISGYTPFDGLRPAGMSNIIGDSSETIMNPSDVRISIHKLSSEGSSLRIIFLDEKNKFIDPAKFNLTDWENLLHGFNMEKTNTYVKYDVAYPIPLVEKRTSYTTEDGRYAHLKFSYDRLFNGGFRVVADLLFDFAIYTKGSWEIIIAFPKEAPRFRND